MSASTAPRPVNILLVDDQPAKLLSYEATLGDLGENLIRANNGDEALQQLLKTEFAVVLMDVCMPGLDGFELAAMIRKHPRFQKTAIIHVSAVNLSDYDRLKGYDSGAVDYVSVPIVPEVLRAKVKVFADLYRKTEELERFNRELGRRVTERTEQFETAVARLRHTEERFRQLAETIPSIVWTAGPDGAITYANQRWFDYSGVAAEHNEKSWPELVLHPDDRERRESEWRQALSEGREFEIEVRKRRYDGVYRWFLMRAVPHRSQGGEVVGWFGVTTDIHDQKEMADQLREADRRKDEFLATLAHELRNPLAAISSALEVLRHPDRSEVQARGGQDVIERQTKHLTRLIDDLVDVSRITRDKLELRKERVELADVVRSAVEGGRSLAQGRELTVSLPPEPIHLEADRIRLAQVLLNLLSNAVKYTKPGGQIRLSAERDSGEVVVRVSDDGIGVAPQALPRLFGMFYQVDSSLERTQGGLGIGLTLARRLIEMHGGRIDATSAGLGKGCELVVRLPGLLEPPAASKASSPNATGKPAVATRRVLIADDNADAAQSLALLLKLSGHDVQTALDGAEAVEAAGRFKPEVAVLDLGMPRVNGYDAARRIREQPWGKKMLLIAATGWAKEEDRRRAKEAGFDVHLVKPLDPAALLELLSSSPATGGRGSRNA